MKAFQKCLVATAVMFAAAVLAREASAGSFDPFFQSSGAQNVAKFTGIAPVFSDVAFPFRFPDRQDGAEEPDEPNGSILDPDGSRETELPDETVEEDFPFLFESKALVELATTLLFCALACVAGLAVRRRNEQRLRSA